MVHIEADKPKNLLTIRFEGVVDVEELKRHLEMVEPRLADLQPGFELLVDLTALEFMEVAGAPYIERAMESCNRKGIKRIVRVIPDPRKDIGLKIMSFFHYDR